MNHDFDRQWLGDMYAAMGWLTLTSVVMSASAILAWQVSWFWGIGIIVGGYFGLVSLRHLFIQTGRIHQQLDEQAAEYQRIIEDQHDKIVTLQASLANCRLSREGKPPAAEARGDLLASAADERKQIVYHLENYRKF